MNRALWIFGAWLGLMACGLPVSCTTRPRELPPLPPQSSSGSGGNSAITEVNNLRYNPEVFPFVLSMPARDELLTINWAMQRAVDEGALKVRLVAPPLQLMGDPNLDRSSSYEAILVADDLKTNEWFLDVYEVRVSPKPELYVVRPATSAKSLRESDLIMAEEELARLRLDQETLKAGSIFATNFAASLSNSLANAQTVSSNKLASLVSTNALLATNLANLAASLQNVTNMLATNRTPDLVRSNALLLDTQQTLQKQKTKIEENQADVERALSLMEAQLRGAQSQADLSKAVALAIDSLQTFWQGWASSRTYLSDYSTNGPSITNHSAVSILLRPQSVANLDHLTIDVIRKQSASTPEQARHVEETNSSQQSLRAFSDTLGIAETAASRLDALLLASDKSFTAESRERQMQALIGRLYLAKERLSAQAELLNEGLLLHVSSAPTGSHSTDVAMGGNPVQFLASEAAANISKLVARFQSWMTDATNLQSELAQAQQQGTNVAAAWANLNRDLADQQQTVIAVTNLLSRFIPGTNGAAATNLGQAMALFPAFSGKVATSLSDSSRALTLLTNALGTVQQSLGTLQTDQSNAVNSLQRTLTEDAKVAEMASQLHQAQANLLNSKQSLAAVIAYLDRLQGDTASNWVSQADETSDAATLRKWNGLFTNALEVIDNQLSDVCTSLENGSSAKQFQRDSIRIKTVRLRGSLDRARTLLASHPHSLDKDPLSQKNLGDLVQRILSGRQAVFQLNVLHGVVTTTAFLLADDSAAGLFGHKFADHFYAAQVTFRNQNDKPILVYGNTMRLLVRMNALADGELSEDGQSVRRNWWATFEPLDYDALRRMVEAQQAHSFERRLTQLLDLALMAGGGWVGVGAPVDFTRAFGVVSALSPKLRDMIEADLRRNAVNFREKALNNIEEIPAQGVLTRYVFLPKGPIFGTYSYDDAQANNLPSSSAENRWAPFSPRASDFGKRALQPAYIHDIRREAVYVEGKRILASDSLTSHGTR